MIPLVLLSLLSQSISVGALGQAAPGFGYKNTWVGYTEFESKYFWELFEAGPLAKMTVRGGEYFSSGSYVAAVRHGSFSFGPAVGVAEELAPIWHKTTLFIGPGLHYSHAGVRGWLAVDPHNWITPNGGYSIGGGMELKQNRLNEVFKTSVGWYDQPFTYPVEKNRFGFAAQIGVGWRVK